MRAAAAEERFEEAARYRNRLFAVESLAQRQAADRRAVGTVDVIGLAVERRPRRGAGLPAARRPAGRPLRVPPRERRRAGSRDDPRVVLPRALRRRADDPAADRRPARHRGHARRSPRSSATCAARASRCGRPSEARSGGSPSSRTRTRGSRSSTRRAAAEQKRRGAIEALEQLRESLNLESLPLRIECFDVSNIQGREIVASMAVFVDGAAAARALPNVRGARARGAGRLRRDGAGRVAPVRAAARRRLARALRRELRRRCRTSS